MTVNLRSVTSADEIKETDHVFQVVDDRELGVTPGTLASADEYGLNIRLGTTVAKQTIEGKNNRTATHELGHTGGLGHIKGQDNLMNQSKDTRSTGITQNQIDQINSNYSKGLLNRNSPIRSFFNYKYLKK